MGHLDIGATLSRVFSTYGGNAGALIAASLMIFAPIAIVVGIIYGLFYPPALTNLMAFGPVDLEQLQPAFTTLALIGVVTGLLGLLGIYFFQGAMAEAANESRGGEPLSATGLLSKAAPFVGRLLVVGLLIWLATQLPFGILQVIGSVAPLAWVLLLVVVPLVFWIMVRWTVAPAAVVIEDQSPTGALSRSAELVEGNFWRVFLVVLVVGLIVAVPIAILNSILPLLLGHGLGYGLAMLVGAGLLAPLAGLAAPVLFLNLRALKEGGAAPAQPPPAAPPPVV